jgi:rhodanese-related sulfurtransferase
MPVDARSSTAAPKVSFVLEYPAADPGEATAHFLAKLTVETDPADVHADLSRGNNRFVVVDARGADDYATCHVPGAVSLPHRAISRQAVAELTRDKVLVVYCWGPACNAATKACAKLSELGFRVKEMIGGIEYWRHEGLPVEGTLGDKAPLHG